VISLIIRLVLLTSCLLFPVIPANAGSLLETPVTDIDGNATTLAGYRGKVLLIVNVASRCGNTPQYAELEALYQKYKDSGLVVLGFPCNQFGNQEPGSNAEIKAFCSQKYSVTFPLFDKVDVNGESRHPLYAALAGRDSPFPGDISWNFEKFLIGRDGRVLHRFAPEVTPAAPAVGAAIEAALRADSTR
jgi:glutathione peroxidase